MRFQSLMMAAVLALTVTFAASAEEATQYGNGVSIETPIPIATLLSAPDQYSGKQVRIDGVVTAVCKKRGCWMEVTDPDSGKSVRLKVEDGVMVFPLTAMGHKTSAEGVFEVIKMTEEQIQAMKAKKAQEHADGVPCEKHAAEGGAVPCAKHAAEGGAVPCEKHAAEGGAVPCEKHKEAKAEGEPCEHHKVEDTMYLLRGTGALIYS